MMFPQVHKLEAELRHKLFSPNAWMKGLHVNVLTSCPKDELHQWFIGIYGEHIIPGHRPPLHEGFIEKTGRIRRQSRSETAQSSAETKKARKHAVDQI